MSQYTDALIKKESPDKDAYLPRCPERDREKLAELMETVDLIYRNREVLREFNPRNREVLRPHDCYKLIYLAHPYANDPEGNKESVARIARELVEKYPSILIVSPIHCFSYLKEPDDREIALRFCQELLRLCDEVWLCPGWEESEGCRLERSWAEEMGMPVRELKPFSLAKNREL